MEISKDRIVSIDVFRGMTIFFMIIVNNPGSWSYVYPPLLHAPWHGCTPTDLVFPFFLFIVGITVAISFERILQLEHNEKELRSKLLNKITRRTILIFLVGIFLNWFPFFHTHISELRIMGVLQRIALAFGGASLIIIILKKTKVIGVVAFLILIFYWALLYFTGGVDPYSLESNLAATIDPAILGESRVYQGYGIPFDPEGLVATIPSISHVLVGYLFGSLILKLRSDKLELVKKLLIYGSILIIIGLIWNLVFPLNKPLWSSSYVVYTCGIAAVFLAALTAIIDIRKIDKWSYVFKVFGLNPLFSYVLSGIIVNLMIHVFVWNGTGSIGWLYTNIFQATFGNTFGSFMYALSFTMLTWILVWPLYKKNIVIKI